MSPHDDRPTAKIYQFPRRTFVSPAKHENHALADLRQRRAMTVECGSGWYHERALDDERAPRKP